MRVGHLATHYPVLLVFEALAVGSWNLNSPNSAMGFSAWNFLHFTAYQYFCILNRLQGTISFA